MDLCVTMGVYLDKVLLPCIHPKLTFIVNEFLVRIPDIISGDNPTVLLISDKSFLPELFPRSTN